MAKINSGILGGFSGKINTVTGYRRLDKNIISGERRMVSIESNNNLQNYKERLEILNFQYKFFRRGLNQLLTLTNDTAWLTWQNFLEANIKSAILSNPYALNNIKIGQSTVPFINGTFSSVNETTNTATVQVTKLFKFFQYVHGGSTRLLFYRSDTNALNQSSAAITANQRTRSGGISNLGGMNYQLHSLCPYFGGNHGILSVAGAVYAKI